MNTLDRGAARGANLILGLTAALTLAADPVHAEPQTASASGSGDAPAAAWSPEIPRVWEDAAIAALEVPLARPEFSPVHVTSEYYYAMPELEIYRTYPIYHPDHEPPGYWEWLNRQEPALAFDRDSLRTRQDWIRAGEAVFLDGDAATGQELAFVRDRQAYASTGVRLTADGRYPYARYVIRERGEVAVTAFSCASCHTRVLDDGTLVLGAPGDQPLGATLAFFLRQEEAALEVDDGWRVDQDSIDYRFAAAPWLIPDPGAYALGRSRGELADLLEALPAGVFVRTRTSYRNPVRAPDLIGVAERRFLDATGLFHQRGRADLMRYAALNQELDELGSYAGFRPLADDFRTLPDPASQVRTSDAQLFALALFLESLEPPPNPSPFGVAARRGRDVFRAQGCASCHTPPLYTNNRLVPVPGFVVPEDQRSLGFVMSRRVGTDPGLALQTRRGTGYYKVPSLKGVWYRGPFFHDGSLATLEDVFDPQRVQDDYVATGFRGPRRDRGPVHGHEFGLQLDPTRRADLLAFLRTL